MYLGVDYYPEHWDKSETDKDLRRIAGMGANIIRIGEFAWHLMERKEGKFDFSFFDGVLEKAKSRGMKILFGTPTAAFPAWLAAKHPSILSEDEYGHARIFGGRRQYCFNSQVYRDYAGKIVEALVRHYRDEEAIIAWQVDNEFGHEGSDMCYCRQCHEAFQSYLKSKYGRIERLNEAYGTIFWGQTYNEFSEIPLPKPTITTHNPSLQLDWARFRSYSINGFAKEQIELVRSLKGPHQQITHNFSGGFFDKAHDPNVMAAMLDFVSYDNYPVWGGLEEPASPAHIAMAHDYMRGLKKENYWIAEALMGAQGHTVIGYLPRPGQAKMWAYQAMAHGCENLLFFRWRGMTRGAEQFCLGVVDQNDEEGRKYHEVKSFIEEIRSAGPAFNGAIRPEVAVVYDYDNIWSWRFQRQSAEFDFTGEFLRLYTPFHDMNVQTDVIGTCKDFSSYKVLVVPVMQIIDKALEERFEMFVKQGGTIIFSFRAGIRDRSNNIHFRRVFPCHIRNLAGIAVSESEALPPERNVKIKGVGRYGDKEGCCRVWRDLITPETAEVLYGYEDAFYCDKACVTVNAYGKGRVYYIGGGVDKTILHNISGEIATDMDIRRIEAPEGLEVYPRFEGRNEWFVINNHTGSEKLFGEYILEPYGSILVKR